MASRGKPMLQPDLFSMSNPPVKQTAPVENSSVDRKEPVSLPAPMPQMDAPIRLPNPLCAWCYAEGPCDCDEKERELSPNSDPQSLTARHPYKGKGVEDGASMAPSKWKGK